MGYLYGCETDLHAISITSEKYYLSINVGDTVMRKEYVRTLTSKGQVVIPAEVRALLGLQPRDKVIFLVEDHRVTVMRAPMTLEDAFGSVPPLHQPEDFKALREVARAEQAEKTLAEMQEAD